MKSIVLKIPSFIVLAAGLLLLPTAAFSQGEPFAEVENFTEGLAFHVINPAGVANVVLTVTGPCDFRYRQVVDPAKEDAVFRLDATTIDGVYRYNLMREETVDPGIVKVLLEARKADDPEVPRALCRDGKLPAPPASQSEGFRVIKGRVIYDPFAQEERGKLVRASSPAVRGGGSDGPMSATSSQVVGVSSADFVINDDLIVDGSACIGFDCVNGEVFSFDTIRLKENNLRIKFDDTSVVPSFPANDWQLTANESANGGASKFSIEDVSGARTPFTVEANARSHSLYVDDGGRIGSRTSTPSVELHTIDGDTPTLRLQQDGSSGFEPQTWDVAGNETNFFVRDVTNGSALPFRIRPAAPSNAIFIDVDGDVGMGTSTPDAPLDVENGGQSFSFFRLTAPTASPNTSADMTFTDGDTAGTNTGSFRINIQDGDPFEFELDAAGNLIVDGTVTTATQTIPDYVFEPGYELMSLPELAEFIEREKHLPNVPSDAEVKARGSLNMNEMQLALLEKVEELTLYTLQQQQEIQELREQLAKVAESLQD